MSRSTLPDIAHVTPEAEPADEIRTTVQRLSRPHPSGGRIIECAAIQAEGSSAAAIMAWITDHDWEPEAPESPVSERTMGLHGARTAPAAWKPHRYVSPPAGS